MRNIIFQLEKEEKKYNENALNLKLYWLIDFHQSDIKFIEIASWLANAVIALP